MQGLSTPFNRWGGLKPVLVLAASAVALAGCGARGGGEGSSAPPASGTPVSGAPASGEPASSGAASSGPPASSSPPATMAGWVRYSQAGFSIAAPSGFMPDPAHDYTALGPGKDIKGFALTIPASLAKGTNLGADSYIAVETLPGTTPCTAAPFLDSPTAAPPVTTDGIAYSVATASDAGAGNIYDETVYAVQGSSPCLAVRYFIHSLNIGNFTSGTVKAFDRTALVAQFDAIRATLTLDQGK